MINIRLKNPKTVSFKVQNFCVPTVKTRTLKHTIYAAKNIGFSARKNCLQGGLDVRRLDVVTSVGQEPITMRAFDDSVLRKLFCFSTHQASMVVNGALVATDSGYYYIPLLGGLNAQPLGSLNNADCFAYAYSRDRDYVFAGGSDGLFAADKTLGFTKVDVNCKPRALQVFSHRLFALDRDGTTVHFSAALDMTDFSAHQGLAGCFRANSDYGEVIGLDVFENKLLVIQKLGFSVLETAHEPAKFRLVPLARSYKDIVPNTAKVLGDTVFFLTSGGMCRLVGGRITLLDIETEFDANQAEASGFVYENRYYLSFKREGGAETALCGNNTILIIEKFFDSYSLMEDVHVRAFEKVWNGFCSRLGVLVDSPNLVHQLDFGKSEEGGFTRVWESDFFSLGYAANIQYIKQVLIKTACPVDIIAVTNRGEQRRTLSGSQEVQKINFNFKGEVFKIRLVSNSAQADISSLTVVVGFN